MAKKVKMWIQENLRIIIHKFPKLYRQCLRFVRDYGKWYYNRLDKKYHYKDTLQKMRGTKYGQRCFIIGNGPSLRPEDLDKLMKEDCFGANRIFNVFSNTVWRPAFYTIVDWHGVTRDEINSLQAKMYLFGDYFWRKNKINKSNAVVFYGERLLDTELSSFKFSENIAERVYLGATVTYAEIQIAAYLGYKEIYLLGLDHSYAYVSGNSGKIISNPNAGYSHFYKDDNPSKVYADIDGMTNAYLFAKQYADSHGIKILNATRGGKLEVFERVDFDELMKEKKG